VPQRIGLSGCDWHLIGSSLARDAGALRRETQVRTAGRHRLPGVGPKVSLSYQCKFGSGAVWMKVL
jgi:hypothetical protein